MAKLALPQANHQKEETNPERREKAGAQRGKRSAKKDDVLVRTQATVGRSIISLAVERRGGEARGKKRMKIQLQCLSSHIVCISYVHLGAKPWSISIEQAQGRSGPLEEERQQTAAAPKVGIQPEISCRFCWEGWPSFDVTQGSSRSKKS